MSTERSTEEIRQAVRTWYGSAATRVAQQRTSACCASKSCCTDAGGSASSALYSVEELQQAPETAASFGCGNPLLLAQLRSGEVVLDLGSGAGLDVILSAKRVAPGGKAYGLDMTDEMLELARANARKAGVTNVEFLKGHIESIPLPEASVDVIISNCVINLSADKDAVLAEAARVLHPGGRLAVADIVVLGQPLSSEMQRILALWCGCISGALSDVEYRQKLSAAGFQDIEVEVIRTYSLDDLPEGTPGRAEIAKLVGSDTQIASAFIRARKP